MTRTILAVTGALMVGALVTFAPAAGPGDGDQRGLVRCANLIYGDNKTSVCFADHFLDEIESQSNVVTADGFSPVRLDSAELFLFPFAVMTGEGSFSLTAAQRDSLRDYLEAGGFMLASAGCSSSEWTRSFRREIGLIFPEVELARLGPDHPALHTVYDLDSISTKKNRSAHLEGLQIEGRIVVVFSSDGLNDTANAGGSCCCCGGDEIRDARRINVNLLAYALTH